jgi:hypothetical protein
MESVNRVRYLEAKRKQLKELLASDVDTSIPSFTAASTSSSIQTQTLPKLPTTTTTTTTTTTSQASKLPVLSSSSNSSSSNKVDSSLNRKSSASHRISSQIETKQSQIETRQSPISSTPLTYAQKLQLNARYSSFGKANEEAAEKAKLSIEKNKEEVEEKEEDVGNLDIETTRTSIASISKQNTSITSNSAVASTADLAAAATIIGGTSSTMLKRATSPVNVPITIEGGGENNQTNTNNRVFDNIDALDLSLGTAITQEDEDEDEEGQRKMTLTQSVAVSFSSPPRARVGNAKSTSEIDATEGNEASLSGSFVISPSPKRKSVTTPSSTSLTLQTPSRLESIRLETSQRQTPTRNIPSTNDSNSTAAAAAAAVAVAAVVNPVSQTSQSSTDHILFQPTAVSTKAIVASTSPSTSANSVNAFLRQLDEMDEQLGFSTTITSTTSPTKSKHLSPSREIGSKTKATSESVFDILDALDDPTIDSITNHGTVTSSSSVPVPTTVQQNSLPSDGGLFGTENQGNIHSSIPPILPLSLPPPLPPTSIAPTSGPLASYASIRTKVVSMSLELEEKTRVISVLRSQIAQARIVMKARETEAHIRSEQLVTEARKDLENRLSQSLSFTERLLSDKSRLGSEVEALSKALNTERRRSEEVVTEANERLKREVILAQEAEREKEKARRAAWTEATTKEIRARTLKSLEPDVQRLLDKHKVEIERIQQASADEIERAAKRFAAERDAAIEIAKSQAEASGGVQAVESRQAWRAREAALRDEADAQFSVLRDQQRKEIDEERRRSAALSRTVAQEHADEIIKINNEWQNRLDDATRRHADMVAISVREKSEALIAERKREASAREAWEIEERHRLRAEFEAREREAKADAHKLRDEQLRLVASRLDGEALEARRALKAEMEGILKKERDEASVHRQALREEVDRFRSRCEELTRARDDAAASSGNETLRLQQLLDEAKERSVEERTQHRLEYSRMNELQNRLQSRIDILSRELEESRSINARIDERARETISQTVASASQDLAEQKQRLESVQRVHEEEVLLMKTRTSVALRRRDEIISQLRLQVDEARSEADTAKRLMQHARQEILGESSDFLNSTQERVRKGRDTDE